MTKSLLYALCYLIFTLHIHNCMNTIQQLENTVQQVRRDILRMVHKVNSGHPGGSLGCAEFFVVLFKEIMNYKTDFEMDGFGEDLFFLSNGHISPVYYSVLARSGFFQLRNFKPFDCWILVCKDIQPPTKNYQV